LLAVALVIWLAVLPQLGTPGGPVNPSSSGGFTALASQPIQVDPRIPDIITKPAGWSEPVTLAMGPTGIGVPKVVDTGIDALVLVSTYNGMQAVDLGKPSVLWSIDTFTSVQVILDDGTAIVSSSDNQLAHVDLRTGNLTPIGSLPSTDGIIVSADGQGVMTNYDISLDGNYNHLCARSYVDLNTCRWQVEGSTAAGPDVFGQGRWANSADGVINVLSGMSPGFGYDAYSSIDDYSNPEIAYAGPADDVVRLARNPRTWVIAMTPWDTMDDQAKGKSVKLPGEPIPESFDSPILLVDHGDNLGVTAYSWQTGAQLWKASPKLSQYESAYWVFQHYVYLFSYSEYGETGLPNRQNSAIIDAQTGQFNTIDTRFGGVIQAGQRAIYIANNLDYYRVVPGSSDGNVLAAYDGQSSNLKQLWSMKPPRNSSVFAVVADHVIAISTDTGELWVLEP